MDKAHTEPEGQGRDDAGLRAENDALRAENAALRAQNAEGQRFKKILDCVPQTIGLVDSSGRIVYASASGFTSFRYGPEDLEKGLDLFRLIHPDEVPRALAEFTRMAERRLPISDEFTALRKDGSTFPAMIYSLPLEEGGRFSGLVSIILDISQRKEAERRLLESQEELKKAQALLRAAIGQTASGIMIARAPDCQTIMVNAAAEEILGQESAQSLAISDHNQRAISWELREPSGKPVPVAEYPLERSVRHGDSFANKELVIRRKDGSERWVLVNGCPVHDETGEIVAGIVVFSDVTGIKEAERELQKVENLESLGLLAGGIAHDFNNILTIILGNLSLLRLDARAGDPSLALLDDMRLAIARAERLTFQLLTFAKGGAPIKETASLGEIVRDSASFVLRGSSVHCDYAIPEDLWPAEFDKGQISQVIQNLVMNAVQAMPGGGSMEIKASNAALGEGNCENLAPGPYLRISVRDRGTGIPAGLLDRIFDPYYTTKESGSGLGLAIAYSIVRKHGGRIGAESEEGRGSVFTIHMPARPGAEADAIRGKSCLVRAEGLILVMDDEAGLRSVLCRFLNHLGLETVAAADGEGAIKEFEKARGEGREFLFVILDLTVPGGMGGLETFRAMHKIDPGLKAIVCSGYSQDTVMAHYLEYGFSGVLKKPFDLSQLSQLVNSLRSGGA